MAEQPAGARSRRILVIANETCAGREVIDEVAYRAGGPGAEVIVVAPALARSRLEHWLNAGSPESEAAAAQRLAASVEALTRAGMRARGHLGDPAPLQALDDALRIYEPDEVIISTHPPARSTWLERQVVRRARELYRLPITHVVVDMEHESSSTDVDTRPGIDGRGQRPLTRVFHQSSYDEAIAIRQKGFRDGDSGAGVLVSERPPEVSDPSGDAPVVFAVDLPEEVLAGHEEGGAETGRYRLPAELLNRHGPPIAVGDWSE